MIVGTQHQIIGFGKRRLAVKTINFRGGSNNNPGLPFQLRGSFQDPFGAAAVGFDNVKGILKNPFDAGDGRHVKHHIGPLDCLFQALPGDNILVIKLEIRFFHGLRQICPEPGRQIINSVNLVSPGEVKVHQI